MKRLKNLKNVAFAILVGASAWSCVDNNDFELPVIERPEPIAIEAATADSTVYKVGEYVKIHGNIVVDGNWSYFELSDGTRIQIYAASKQIAESLSDEQKKKLATPGQEVTVTGTFKDYKQKDGKVKKEIVYNRIEDIIFGDNVVTPEIVKLEADKATIKDYEVSKKVELHGNIVVDGKWSYFELSDGTRIQIYAASKQIAESLSDDKKEKLATPGQEITVTGTFKDYKQKDGKVKKEIVYESTDDLVFGKAPEQGGSETPPAQGATGGIFKLEDLKGDGYNGTGSLTEADGTVVLEYKARTNIPDAYIIDKGGLMLRKKEDNYITITFKNGIKKLSFDYRRAYGSEEKFREINIYKGDKLLKTITFENPFKEIQHELLEINETGEVTITFKVNTDGPVVFDNLAWGDQATEGSGNGGETTPPANVEKGTFELEYGKEPTAQENVTLTYNGADPKGYAIDGKGVLVRGAEDGFITLVFKEGVKKISLNYKRAYLKDDPDGGILKVLKNNEELKSFTIKDGKVSQKEIEINETGEVTVTFKSPSKGGFVIDKITWTKEKK